MECLHSPHQRLNDILTQCSTVKYYFFCHNFIRLDETEVRIFIIQPIENLFACLLVFSSSSSLNTSNKLTEGIIRLIGAEEKIVFCHL